MMLACGLPPFLIYGFFGWIGFILLGVASLMVSYTNAGLARGIGICSLVLTLPIPVAGLLILSLSRPNGPAALALPGSPLPAVAGLAVARNCAAKPPAPHRCRNCNYQLRGLIEPRCPECGTPFARLLLRPPPRP